MAGSASHARGRTPGRGRRTQGPTRRARRPDAAGARRGRLWTNSFGAEAAGWFHQGGVDAAHARLAQARAPQWFGVGGGGTSIRVFIGDRELTDLIGLEVNGQMSTVGNNFTYGRAGF